MNWLLKIVEGPMKGAEIALPGGTRVTFGRAATCDIVIADQALADEAFALDVGDTGVTLIPPGGEGESLVPFEIREFGSTAVALGPAEGAWEELRKPEPKVASESEASVVTTEEMPSEKAEESMPATAVEPKGHSGRLAWILGVIVGLIVLLILACLFAWFGPYAENVRSRVEKCFEKPVVLAVEPLSLAEIAGQHGLVYVDRDGEKRISGNVKRRTERLAIRALAQATDASVTFDLTDDETLLKAADELLFAVTEGAIKAVSASNRIVTIAGQASDAVALEHVVRALSADVKGLEKLDTKRVRVGLPTAATPAAPKAKATPVYSLDKPKVEPVRKQAEKEKPVRKTPGPIAGILTKPYPCVVMANGLRLTEGAAIGSAVIEKIEAERLVLRDGDIVFDWKP